MLLFVAVGFVLIGLLALMPSRPHENEKTRRSGVAQASRIRKFIAASIACTTERDRANVSFSPRQSFSLHDGRDCTNAFDRFARFQSIVANAER
jgi:hypothetical protein